jgi:hypothetical protein
LSKALGVVLLGQILGKSSIKAALAVEEEALLVILEAPLETFKMSEMSSVLWLVVTVTAASLLRSHSLLQLKILLLFSRFPHHVTTLDWLDTNLRSQMAVLLVPFLPKDFGQLQWNKGIASLSSITVSVPILVLERTSLLFSRVISTLYCPFC